MKQWEVVILVLILLTAESYFLTSTKAQSRAVLLYPEGRARTRKGNLLPARAIADSPLKKKNVIHMRWSVIRKDQHRERDSRQKKQSV